MNHQTPDGITWSAAGAEHFTGEVWLGSRHAADTPHALSVIAVCFAAGSRSDWHRHPAGQVLFVVEGTALVQTEGGLTATVAAGDVVWAPAGEVHWHGAGPDGSMTHLSITDGGPTEWLNRKVIDEEYRSAGG
jgi:quercetin dioxygenase-like cupin family protein